MKTAKIPVLGNIELSVYKIDYFSIFTIRTPLDRYHRPLKREDTDKCTLTITYLGSSRNLSSGYLSLLSVLRSLASLPGGPKSLSYTGLSLGSLSLWSLISLPSSLGSRSLMSRPSLSLNSLVSRGSLISLVSRGSLISPLPSLLLSRGSALGSPRESLSSLASPRGSLTSLSLWSLMSRTSLSRGSRTSRSLSVNEH